MLKLIEYLQNWSIPTVLASLAAAMAIIGGLYGFSQFVAGLYDRFLPHQVFARDLVLHAEWSDNLMIHRHKIRAGDTLDGVYSHGARLVLSLSNAGRVDLSDLTLQISGNARFRGEPSSYFDYGVQPEATYTSAYIWHSKPNIIFQKDAPPRDVGSFSWDRDSGRFWARIQVSARKLTGGAEFFVGLRPPM